MRRDEVPRDDTRRRRAPRRWIVPSALLHDPAFVGTFDGYAILREVPDEDAAFAVFQIYRAVMLWARTQPEHRDGLFAPELHEHVVASAYTGLGQQLDGVLAACAVFEPASPGAAARVAAGCMALAEAAARQDWHATALALQMGAACVDPEEPAAALAVGQAAVQAERSAVAEMWLRRAVVLGRRRRDWAVASRAYLELGRIALRAGSRRMVPARRLLTVALRTARRHRVRDVVGEAADQLHRLAREAGEHDAAEAFAARAIRAYGPGPATTRVRESMAELRLAQGAPGDAVGLLERVLAAPIDAAPDRVRALTTMVAALGSLPGLPQSIRIRRYADEAATLIADHAPHDRAGAVRALLALASAVAPADQAFAGVLRRQAFGLAKHTEDAALLEEVRSRLAPLARERAAGAA